MQWKRRTKAKRKSKINSKRRIKDNKKRVPKLRRKLTSICLGKQSKTMTKNKRNRSRKKKKDIKREKNLGTCHLMSGKPSTRKTRKLWRSSWLCTLQLQTVNKMAVLFNHNQEVLINNSKLVAIIHKVVNKRQDSQLLSHQHNLNNNHNNRTNNSSSLNNKISSSSNNRSLKNRL